MTLIDTNTTTTDPSPADPPAAAAPAAGMSVLRRDGSIAEFDPGRISVAITKAFLAVEGETAGRSSRLRALVVDLTDAVVGTLRRRYGSDPAPGRPVDLEEVQDQVELALMRDGHAAVARAYILYREEHRRARADRAFGTTAAQAAPQGIAAFSVVDVDGARTDPGRASGDQASRVGQCPAALRSRRALHRSRRKHSPGTDSP